MKRDFRLPYEYFQCRSTRQYILKSLLCPHKPGRDRAKIMIHQESLYKALLFTRKADGLTYLVPKSSYRFIDRGAWLGYSEQLYDHADTKSGDCVIACPGPSLDAFDFDSCRVPVFACNSAGFRLKEATWVIFEASYAKWLYQNHAKAIRGRTLILTGRGACHWESAKPEKVLVSRFEEERQMPVRAPAVTVMGALFSAWFMGFDRAFLVGLDVSRPKGQPYISGVPYTAEGASNSFNEQPRALNQVVLPGLEIINGSPHSKGLLKFRHLSYKEITGEMR